MLAVAEILTIPSDLVTLFIGSLLASTLLPGGSEAMLLFALQYSSYSPWQLWLVASLGNTMGGLSSWLIGWWLARCLPQHAMQSTRHRQALARISSYGSPLLLFSWLPLIGDPLCVAAGWSGIRLLPASLYISIGKATRYAAVMGLSLMT